MSTQEDDTVTVPLEDVNLGHEPASTNPSQEQAAAPTAQTSVRKTKGNATVNLTRINCQNNSQLEGNCDYLAFCIQRKCCTAYNVLGAVLTFIFGLFLMFALFSRWMQFAFHQWSQDPYTEESFILSFYLNRVEISGFFNGGSASPSVRCPRDVSQNRTRSPN